MGLDRQELAERLMMAKKKTGRNAGSAARATKQEIGLVARSGVPIGASSAQKKTEVQLQAERIAEKYFTDMMAGAGVHVDRMALEVLYWLPRDFIDMYMELYMRALRNTDGGTGERGQAAAETGALGKAKGKAQGGKKFKKYWTVTDEHVLEMKGRVDRRLRQMTRDFRTELDELDWKRSRQEKVKKVGSTGSPLAPRRIPTCPHCKIIVSLAWRFCAKCGTELNDARAKETKMRVERSRENRQAG